jgi:hypothetical protein
MHGRKYMYKKVFLILCAIILLGVLASCGQDDYDDGRDDAPPPPDYRSGRITLLNDTSLPISEIHLRPSSEFEVAWGANELSTDLLPGELWTYDLKPDTYDFKIATKDTLSIYNAYLDSIRIDAWQKVVRYAKDLIFSGSLKIVNVRTDANIEEISWSPRGLDTWSANQITSGSIPPGDSIQLLDLKPGSYDIRIVWSKPPVNVDYNSKNVESLALLTLDVM